jgi:hypothetical protein
MAEAVTKEEVQWFVKDFIASPPAVRAQVLSQLRRDQVEGDSAFYCERLGCTIAIPCGLKACDFHVADKKLRNCRLSARGKERNEVADIAAAFGVDEAEAKQMLADVFMTLREASLQEAMDAANVNRYTLMPHTNVCVVCGGVTDTPYQVTDEGFMYCRKECFREKPPNLLRIECLFRADVRYVLRVALNTFKQIPMIASALRIQRSSLLRHYEFYLGIKPHQFGVDVADIVDLLRTRRPTTFDDFIVFDRNQLLQYPGWKRLEDIALALARTL